MHDSPPKPDAPAPAADDPQPDVALGPSDDDRRRLQSLAMWQRLTSAAILLNAVATVGFFLAPLAYVHTAGLGWAAQAIFAMVCVYKLGAKMDRKDYAWLFVIGQLIPCIALATLLFAHAMAARALREFGWRVSFFRTTPPPDEADVSQARPD